MAHMLDESNGRYNMAFVGDVAWHGLGHRLSEDASINEWVKAAGLDWEAISHGFASKDADGIYHDLPDRQVLVRSDTQAYLGNFSNRYVAAQPADILAFFNNFILVDDRFKLETAGSLKGGRVIWALARFKDDIKLFGKDNERHAQYVFLTTSFDGSLATTAQATVIRVVCANTHTASIFSPQSATLRVRHNAAFQGVIAEDAARQLAEVAKAFDVYEGMADALNSINVNAAKTRDFFKSLLPPPVLDVNTKKITVRSEQAQVKGMAQLYKLLDKTVVEGAERGSAWALFNTVTDYVDHDRKAKRTVEGETVANAKMFASFIGSGVQIKSKALRGLLDLGGKSLKDFGDDGVAADEFELA